MAALFLPCDLPQGQAAPTERLWRIALLCVLRVETRNPAFVVKLEKSLLQNDRGMCDAPRMCEHSFCALGMRSIAAFVSAIRVQDTPVTFHESKNSTCVSRKAIPQKTT